MSKLLCKYIEKAILKEEIIGLLSLENLKIKRNMFSARLWYRSQKFTVFSSIIIELDTNLDFTITLIINEILEAIQT